MIPNKITKPLVEYLQNRFISVQISILYSIRGQSLKQRVCDIHKQDKNKKKNHTNF